VTSVASWEWVRIISREVDRDGTELESSLHKLPLGRQDIDSQYSLLDPARNRSESRWYRRHSTYQQPEPFHNEISRRMRMTRA
jgi:hypothetical protein